MCLIISIVLFVLGFNLYNAEDYLASAGSFISSLIFMMLMIRNIQYVKKRKKERENDN